VEPLTPQEWTLVAAIHGILGSINRASQTLCAEKYPTLSLLMPYFDEVLDCLEKNISKFRSDTNEEYDSVADGCQAAYDKCMRYFEVSSDLAVVATVMDPRFKLKYYESNDDARYPEIVTTMVENIARKLKLDQDENITSTVKQPDARYFVSFLQNSNCDPTAQTTMQQLQVYLADSLADRNINPLVWWKLNACLYPKLAEVAKVVLTIPATSAASERLFSGARLAMPWNRTRLSSSTLQAIMCLRYWLKLDPVAALNFEELCIAEENDE